jgi:hypothetical protein
LVIEIREQEETTAGVAGKRRYPRVRPQARVTDVTGLHGFLAMPRRHR